MKLEFSWYIFEKYSNTKLHEKSIQWELRYLVWMNMTKLIVNFHNSANAPKKKTKLSYLMNVEFLSIQMSVPQS